MGSEPLTQRAELAHDGVEEEGWTDLAADRPPFEQAEEQNCQHQASVGRVTLGLAFQRLSDLLLDGQEAREPYPAPASTEDEGGEEEEEEPELRADAGQEYEPFDAAKSYLDEEPPSPALGGSGLVTEEGAEGDPMASGTTEPIAAAADEGDERAELSERLKAAASEAEMWRRRADELQLLQETVVVTLDARAASTAAPAAYNPVAPAASSEAASSWDTGMAEAPAGVGGFADSLRSMLPSMAQPSAASASSAAASVLDACRGLLPQMPAQMTMQSYMPSSLAALLPLQRATAADQRLGAGGDDAEGEEPAAVRDPTQRAQELARAASGGDDLAAHDAPPYEPFAPSLAEGGSRSRSRSVAPPPISSVRSEPASEAASAASDSEAAAIAESDAVGGAEGSDAAAAAALTPPEVGVVTPVSASSTSCDLHNLEELMADAYGDGALFDGGSLFDGGGSGCGSGSGLGRGGGGGSSSGAGGGQDSCSGSPSPPRARAAAPPRAAEREATEAARLSLVAAEAEATADRIASRAVRAAARAVAAAEAEASRLARQKERAEAAARRAGVAAEAESARLAVRKTVEKIVERAARAAAAKTAATRARKAEEKASADAAAADAAADAGAKGVGAASAAACGGGGGGNDTSGCSGCGKCGGEELQLQLQLMPEDGSHVQLAIQWLC